MRDGVSAPPPEEPDPGDLRGFAIALYGREGVASACLDLQERLGLDVNLLLFGAWLAAERSVALTPAQIAAARDEVAAWHDEVVKPLRAVRRQLRTGPAPAPSPRTDELRKSIQAIEIAAELIELDRLDAIGRRLPSAPSAPGSHDRVERNLAEIVANAAGRTPHPQDHVAILAIAARTRPQPSGA
jgi:uncharacterized protein (TIGR02444 family)